MARDAKDRVNITLRISEDLRARLERAADTSGQSLNSEINERLERAFEARGLLAELFGDDRSFEFLMTLAVALKQVQRRIGGGEWSSDPAAQDAVSEAVVAVLAAYTRAQHYVPTGRIEDPYPDPKSVSIGRAAAELALRLTDRPRRPGE